MMTETNFCRVPKWPFFTADACLLVLAFFIVDRAESPLTLLPMAAALAAVAVGAFLGVWPFVLQHRAALTIAEADRLAGAASQLQHLDTIAAQITGATARWQTAQDAADQTTAAAKAIAEKINGEALAFQEFLKKNNDGEKAALRLEVEKLHRAQGEWLQLAVRTLDHVFALHQAAVRAEQPAVIAQLTQFQATCRDLARRLGLVAVMPETGDVFDEKSHQSPETGSSVPEGAHIANVLAPGYTFQGQSLRKPLVAVAPPAGSPAQPDTGKPAQAALL